MQSRTPRLGWIAKVLADEQAPRQGDERVALRLVAEGTPVPRRGGKRPTLLAAVADGGSRGQARPRGKSGR